MQWIQYFTKWFLAATPIPIRIVEIALLLLTILGGAIKQIKPEWTRKMEKIAWQIPLGLLVAVFLISLATASYNLYEEKIETISFLKQELNDARKQAYPSVAVLMMEEYFYDKDIPLGQFGLVSDRLVGKTFKKCRIYGPAVLGLKDEGEIAKCRFSGSLETSFIVTTNEKVDGVLVVERCTFLDCEFKNVSFIGKEQKMSELKNGFKRK